MLFGHLSHSKIQVHGIGLSLAVSSTYSMALLPVVSLYGVYSFNTAQPATHHPCELNNVWSLKITNVLSPFSFSSKAQSQPTTV